MIGESGRSFAVVAMVLLGPALAMVNIACTRGGADGSADDSRFPLNRDDWAISKPPPTTVESSRRPLPVQSQPTLVKHGRLPLVYMVESGDGMIVSVVDQTTGQRLARAPVGRRAIVRVEARNGVFYTNERMLPGPLPADHSYAIYLESDQASEIEQTGQRPAAPVRSR